jgi:hypothetical protein
VNPTIAARRRLDKRNSRNILKYHTAYQANPAAFEPRPEPKLTRPPTGYYDPSIDAQVAAGARGLGDLRIDIDTGIRRGGEDFQTAMGGARTQRAQTLADLMTGETRLRDDHRLATEDLGLQFGRLARGQAEGARARGVISSGLAARAAQIRAGNQGRAQAGLDLSRDRGLENIATDRSRFEENYLTQTGLLDRDYQRQYGAGGDLDLQLARGEREQPLLEADANDLRLFQAKQAQWVPPGAPKPKGKLTGRRRRIYG